MARRTEQEWETHQFEREAELQKYVMKKLKALRKQGVPMWYYKASDSRTPGIPDIIMCIAGYFVAIELKRNKASKPTKLQVENLDSIAHAGGYQAVCRTWGEVKHVISYVLKLAGIKIASGT
jgi:Holliday junction resolvase